MTMPGYHRVLRDHYLELLEGCLMGTIHQDVFCVVGNGAMPPWRSPMRRAFRMVQRLSSRYGYELAARRVHRDVLEEGRAWPLVGETMVGLRRLRNIRACLDEVVGEGVAGDFIETGVWRGGCCIYAAAVLGTSPVVNDRKVFVADSFRGLPATKFGRHPQESEEPMSEMTRLAVSRRDVEENFDRYAVGGERVVFVEGWFSETLPTLHDRRWSVIRLDGDLYESTMDALTNLYPRLSIGGFVIVDDYWEMNSCRAAVENYRRRMGIDEPLERVDQACVMWRRVSSSPQP